MSNGMNECVAVRGVPRLRLASRSLLRSVCVYKSNIQCFQMLTPIFGVDDFALYIYFQTRSKVKKSKRNLRTNWQ